MLVLIHLFINNQSRDVPKVVDKGSEKWKYEDYEPTVPLLMLMK
jgi:hypothetical protein